ncbi:MAG TPA: hypothetical protein VFT22_25570 [Kofleriaceae bacterium]|nr:hypothetical protein [Kofleriaceae bacterium]
MTKRNTSRPSQPRSSTVHPTGPGPAELSLAELERVSGGASQVLSQSIFQNRNGEWGHAYTTLSDPLPPGTTREQANDLLQRFNAPTEAAFHGSGNDPSSTSGFVSDPWTGYAPAGLVTFQRGDGIVTNTTTPLHPFEGQITRSLVDNEDGTFSVRTDGRGEGGYTATSLGGYLSGVQEAGHAVNAFGADVGAHVPGLGDVNVLHVPGGPEIFTNLDARMLDVAKQEQLDRFTQQDAANREQGYPGAFGDPPTGQPHDAAPPEHVDLTPGSLADQAGFNDIGHAATDPQGAGDVVDHSPGSLADQAGFNDIGHSAADPQGASDAVDHSPGSLADQAGFNDIAAHAGDSEPHDARGLGTDGASPDHPGASDSNDGHDGFASSATELNGSADHGDLGGDAGLDKGGGDDFAGGNSGGDDLGGGDFGASTGGGDFGGGNTGGFDGGGFDGGGFDGGFDGGGFDGGF